MASAAAPPPIIGTPIDPPPGEVPAFAEKLDQSTVGGIAYRTLLRYTNARVGLLAAGTAYYMFLSLLSLLAFAYGIIAVIGADELASRLTESLNQALPGLVGDDGIDPELLRATGTAAGIVGLIVMLYSSLGAVNGASGSMHMIYGAPPDPRPFLKAKLRAVGLLLMVTPLMAVSFIAVTLTSQTIEPVLETLGWNSPGTVTMLNILGLVVGFLLDMLILWILLGSLGGIRPMRRPRLIGSLLGAVGIGLLKQLMDLIVGWSLDKPQYGALALPLATLFVLSLMATVLYVSAALVGGISDAETPLSGLVREAETEPAPD
jgi:membrane protein